MTEPERTLKLGRYMENTPLLLMELRNKMVESTSVPGSLCQVTGIYYNRKTKRLRVVYKAGTNG